MNVAFFGETVFPSHNIKWINHLTKELKVNAIVLTKKGQDYSHINPEVTVYDCIESFPRFNRVRRAKVTKNYEAILNKHNVKIVHFLWGVEMCLWALELNRKYIITTRGSDVLRLLPQKYMNLKFELSYRFLLALKGRQLHKSAYSNASWVTSTSNSQKESINSFQPLVQNHSIIRTGSYAGVFQSDKIQVSNRPRRFFSPRTMRDLYNQDIIIDAFSNYLKIYPDSTLRMVDNHPEGDWSKKMKELAKGLKIEGNITFLIEMSQEEIKDEYQAADVCIMIPKSDGVPVSGIECMLVGTPLIVGGLDYDKDLFNDETVWKLPKTTSVELLECMKVFNHGDEKLIYDKVLNAQTVAKENASTENEMRKIYNIYQSLVS